MARPVFILLFAAFVMHISSTFASTDDIIRDNSSTSDPDNSTSATTVAPSVALTMSSLEVKAEKLQKLKEKLNGKVLNVTTINDFPLSYIEMENGKPVGRGVAFKVLEFLTEKFNFTINIVPLEKDIIGSKTDYQGSLVQCLNESRADLAAAFVPLLGHTRSLITYSTTILDEGEWIMIMKRPPSSADGSGLMAPFTTSVWLLILLSLLTVGPLIYGLIVLRYKLTKDRSQQTYPMPHCVWFVYGALMKQGSTLAPVASSTRLIFSTWWIFITILTSFYTANLTAFLTLSKFTLPIKKVDDLISKDKEFVAHRGSCIEYAITNNNESVQLKSMFDRGKVDFISRNDSDYLDDYVEKRNYIFVRDRPAIDHLIYRDYQSRRDQTADEKTHCPFATSKYPFLKRKRAFAYPMGTEWNALFDPELLHLVESGIVKFRLLEGLPNTEICPLDLGSTERQLRNSDLSMTYRIMLAGYCTAAVVCFTEILFKCLNSKLNINRGDTLRVHNNMRDKFSKQSVSVTPPPSYATLFNRSRSNNKIWSTDSFTHTPADNGTAVQQLINGRNYMVFKTNQGETRLVPIRTPSAALFEYAYTK